MNEREYKVGDLVEFREWDDLVEEFGGDCDVIETPILCVVEKMRYLCGERFRISEIETYPSGTPIDFFRSEEGIENDEFSGSSGFWYITKHMVRHVEESEDVDIPVSDWESVLLQ